MTGANIRDVRKLRKLGGLWLRGLREAAGLSQRQLAARLSIEAYTFVSQIENGRGRIPPAHFEIWAEALNVSLTEFAKQQLRFYDPVTYEILFEPPISGDDSAADAKVRRK